MCPASCCPVAVPTGRPRQVHLRERDETVRRNQKPARRPEHTRIKGNRMSILVLACVAITLFISGCASSDENYLTEQQALDAAWKALEPNTSSHNQANWQAVTIRLVDGHEVAGQFEGEPAPGCVGTTPPPNKQISAGKHWHVVMQPTPATPRPFPDTPSPTAPPLIPEPFTREARFLLDARDGTVVARKLLCVIY